MERCNSDAPFHRYHHDPHGGPRPGDFGGFGPHGFGPHGGPFDGRGWGGFGPRGRKRAARGDIRAAILSLLADGRRSGYALIKAIAEKTDGLWRPSPGSVYPTLQQLVDEDLVVPIGNDRRTEYELSDAGKAYVADHEDELAAAWNATPGRTESGDALFASVGQLMGVVHQFRFAGTEEQKRKAAEKLDEARRALYLILAD